MIRFLTLILAVSLALAAPLTYASQSAFSTATSGRTIIAKKASPSGHKKRAGSKHSQLRAHK
jgi:hypothetical protein